MTAGRRRLPMLLDGWAVDPDPTRATRFGGRLDARRGPASARDARGRWRSLRVEHCALCGEAGIDICPSCWAQGGGALPYAEAP